MSVFTGLMRFLINRPTARSLVSKAVAFRRFERIYSLHLQGLRNRKMIILLGILNPWGSIN